MGPRCVAGTLASGEKRTDPCVLRCSANEIICWHFPGVLDDKLDSIAQAHPRAHGGSALGLCIAAQIRNFVQLLGWLVPALYTNRPKMQCLPRIGRTVLQNRNAAVQFASLELEFQAAQLFHAAPKARRRVRGLSVIFPEPPYVPAQAGFPADG